MPSKKKNSEPALAPNAFAGRSSAPTQKDLAKAIGGTLELWERLVARNSQQHHLEHDWHSSLLKHGWALRLRRKDRNIVYLGPCDGFFRASFVLGDKAVAAARHGNLPASAVKIVNGARRYAEGTAVRIEVRTAQDLDVVDELIRIKLEN